MTIENLVDTLLNVWVFAFIGILAWLYFKKESNTDTSERQSSD
jgi:hypothetical protein